MDSAELALIQREIDGENAPADRSRFQALVERDPEARKTYEDLRWVAASLGDLPLAEPPSYLRTQIMDALADRPEYVPVGRRSNVSAFFDDMVVDLRELMTGRPALAFGYAFGVGLLVGVALYAVVLGEQPAEEDLYGTLVAGEEMADAASVYESNIQLSGFEASVEAFATGTQLGVALQVDADEEVEVRLRPGPDLALRGLTRSSEGAAPSFRATRELVELDVSGTDRYTVLFNRPEGATPPLRLEVWRGGERVHVEDILADP